MSGSLVRPDGGPLRVVLAEDLPLLREGIVAVLSRAGAEVVLAATTADELLSGVASLDPDLVLTDVRMPPSHTDEGLRAVSELRRSRPGLPVLLLSQYVSVAYLPEILDQPGGGGVGYLLKERVGHVSAFTDAVRSVLAGSAVIDPDVVAALLGRSHAADSLSSLTPREREVLALMAEGKTNSAIAESLWVSEAAVRKHVGSIFSKLPLGEQTDRRVSAVLAYLRGAQTGS